MFPSVAVVGHRGVLSCQHACPCCLRRCLLTFRLYLLCVSCLRCLFGPFDASLLFLLFSCYLSSLLLVRLRCPHDTLTSPFLNFIMQAYQLPIGNGCCSGSPDLGQPLSRMLLGLSSKAHYLPHGPADPSALAAPRCFKVTTACL